MSTGGRQPITLAVLAIGGQGGGVLSNWLLALAESNGWQAQTTSVPGVAQRTGATVYYLEMVPEGGPVPVLALMPAPGDVDVVVAAELMEAGRAIQRGMVSPEKTTLIASSHRSLAVSEKAVPGDGAADAGVVLEAARDMAHRFVYADMARIADDAGSVISAALFGAIAAAGVLPFEREQFEATIRRGGVGVAASLRAFAGGFEAIAGFDAAAGGADPPAAPDVAAAPALSGGGAHEQARYQALRERVAATLPAGAQSMALAGLDAVVDFQDARYGETYLDQLAALHAVDANAGGADHDFALTAALARYLARAMTYDDVIRVADLKTRAARFARVRDELRVDADAVVGVTEFMHPRLEELCGTLPVALGRLIETTPWLAWLGRKLTDRPRRVRTDTLHWFVALYAVAGLRRWRLRSLRHSRERAHWEAWLALVRDTAARNYPLGVAVVRCRQLIKGYSDTHARGLAKYDRVLGAVPALIERADGAAELDRLREAALADEDGDALTGQLERLQPMREAAQ